MLHSQLCTPLIFVVVRPCAGVQSCQLELTFAVVCLGMLAAYRVSIPNASYVRCHTPALNDDAVYLKPKYVAIHVVHMDGYNAWPQGAACYEDKALASSWTS